MVPCSPKRRSASPRTITLPSTSTQPSYGSGLHSGRLNGSTRGRLVVVAAVQPRVAELAHRVDDREERLALPGQLVLDARRRLGVAVPLDDPLLLERAQPLGERPRADAAAGVLELREAAGALGKVVDEQCRPLGADDLGRGGDRTGRRLVHRKHRPWSAHASDCTFSSGAWGFISPRAAGCAPSGRRPSSRRPAL